MQRIPTNRDTSVFAFVREKENQKILVICNLSNKAFELKLNSNVLTGNYMEIFTHKKKQFKRKDKLTLQPWEYCVYEKNNN